MQEIYYIKELMELIKPFGKKHVIRHLDNVIGNFSIPNEGEIYPNTIHSHHLLIPFDMHVTLELCSPQIQQDVVSLLNSANSKFAQAIGFGSPCKIPT